MPSTWSQVDGTIYGNPELSRTARMSPDYMTVCRDAVTPAPEFSIGRKSGSKVGYKLYGRIGLNNANVALQETEKVPFGSLLEYYASAQIYRRAFAIPWTDTREALDRLDIESAIIKTLNQHAARVENKQVYDAMIAGRSFSAVATGPDTMPTTTNGTPAVQATNAFGLFHARKLKLFATQKNIPTFDGGNWLFIGSPNIEDGLNSDVDFAGWVDVSKYAPSGAEGAMQGEIGKVQRMRFSIDNSPEFADGIGAGSAFGSGFLLGDDAVREMIIYPMHFRVNTNLGGDFGNQIGIAWQSMVDFVVPWNFTTHGDGRILHYTSN